MMRQPDEYFERDEDGIRLKGHRIWLEDVLGMYLGGMTPEQIAAEYYTVSLEEAQAAVAYYEAHRAEVDVYLEQQRREAEEREREAKEPARALRAAIDRAMTHHAATLEYLKDQ